MGLCFDRCDDGRISNDNKAWGTWNHYPIYARICEDDWAIPVKKWKKNWCGWKPRLEIQNKEHRKKLLEGEEVSLRDLSGIQDQIEKAAKKIAHLTKGERKKIIRQTPEHVKNREVAAARCKRVMERRVLSKQARRARADHLVKCSMEPGRKKKKKRKPLLELFVDGNFYGRQRSMAEGAEETL